jgi:hypothetical protein
MLPGENLNNPADNLKIHDRIMADYARRWPNDPARWAVAYQSGPGNVAPPGSPTPWKRNIGDVNETVSKYVANTQARMGVHGGASPPAPSSAPSAAAPAPPTTPTVGAMLAGLTPPTGSSGTQQASSDTGGGGGSQQQPEAPQNDLQGQQAAAAMGQARQQQIAAQAQQMVASMLSRGRQPLAWSAAPPGSGAGQMVPGTTLNSIGDQYG